MATLTLKINDEILDKVLWFLKQFKKSDVEIVDEDFLKNQKELQKDFDEARKPNAKFYSLEEADAILNDAIEKYGNSSSK